jgi:hypothetical protein
MWCYVNLFLIPFNNFVCLLACVCVRVCVCVCHYQPSVFQPIKFYNRFYCVRRERALLTCTVRFVNTEYKIMLCGWTQFVEPRRKTLTFFCYTFNAVVLTWWHSSWYIRLETVMIGFTETLYSPYGHLHHYQTKEWRSNCQIQGHYFIWQLSPMFTQTISQVVRHCSPHHIFNLPCIRAHAFLCHVLWLILHFLNCHI